MPRNAPSEFVLAVVINLNRLITAGIVVHLVRVDAEFAVEAFCAACRQRRLDLVAEGNLGAGHVVVVDHTAVDIGDVRKLAEEDMQIAIVALRPDAFDAYSRFGGRDPVSACDVGGSVHVAVVVDSRVPRPMLVNLHRGLQAKR